MRWYLQPQKLLPATLLYTHAIYSMLPATNLFVPDGLHPDYLIPVATHIQGALIK